jgi:hypothetical protein
MLKVQAAKITAKMILFVVQQARAGCKQPYKIENKKIENNFQEHLEISPPPLQVFKFLPLKNTLF